AAVLADEDDLDLAGGDDEQGVAGIVLEQDDGVLGIGAVPGDLQDPLQLGRGELAEQGDFLEDRGCGHESLPWRSGGSGEGQAYGFTVLVSIRHAILRLPPTYAAGYISALVAAPTPSQGCEQ